MMYSKVSKILISRRSTLLLHFIQTKTSTSWRTAVVQRSLRTSHYFLFTRCRWFDQNLRCFLYYRCLSSLPFLLRLIAFIWFDFYVAFNSGCFTCVSSGWMDSLSFVAFEKHQMQKHLDEWKEESHCGRIIHKGIIARMITRMSCLWVILPVSFAKSHPR